MLAFWQTEDALRVVLLKGTFQNFQLYKL